MQGQSESFDAIVVGSGISGGLGRQGAHRARPARAAARARQERRARQGLHERAQGALGVSASRRPHARDGRRLPRPQARLSAEREEASTGGSTRQESPYTEVKRFDWYRGYHVGGRSLTWGRQSYRHSDLDFEANAKEGIARRLADPLRRHRAVVRPRRAPRRHRRIGRRPAAAARRPVPTGDAAQLRRSRQLRAGCREQFEGTRRIIPGRAANLTQPLGTSRAAASTATPAAWLPVRRVLQHAVLDAAGGDGDRPADAQDSRDRDRRGLRRRTASAPPACA